LEVPSAPAEGKEGKEDQQEKQFTVEEIQEAAGLAQRLQLQLTARSVQLQEVEVQLLGQWVACAEQQACTPCQVSRGHRLHCTASACSAQPE
jgi:hypothetical protein